MNAEFEIIKGKRVVANYLTFDGYLYEIMDTLIDMVRNYNENLAGCLLKPTLLALRFFEKKDEFGNSHYITSPMIMHSSRKYITEKYLDFKMTPEGRTTDENGLIAVIDEDMISLEVEADQTIVINLDEAIISFNNCFVEYYPEDYLEMEIDDMSNLTTCEFNLEKLNFNELEEARDFIRNNLTGWLKNEKIIKIVMPREK